MIPCHGRSCFLSMKNLPPVILIASLGWLVGCAHSASGPAAQVPGQGHAPSSQVVPRVVVTPTEAISVKELYERAEKALAAGKPADALRDFDRVLAVEPDGNWAPGSLLDGSAGEEQLDRRDRAVFRLKQLVRRFPNHPLARMALVRIVRLESFLEHWDSAGEAAGMLLARYHDLGPLDSIVAEGGKALALVAAGDLEAASFHVEKGRTTIEQHQLDAPGQLSRDLAQLYYALGEIRRTKASAIALHPVTPEFSVLLERRCQFILDAQSAYSDTMRAYDAHWSAMAGYRVGELYQELHQELMAVEPPKTAGSDANRQLFEGAMRLRYSVLLEKAQAMMDHTVSMAKRTGEQSVWVGRAEAAKLAIEKAMAEEKRVLDGLPYTKEQLEAALTALADKAKKSSPTEATSGHHLPGNAPGRASATPMPQPTAPPKGQ